MKNDPTYIPPKIDPLSGDYPRPLWSVMIPTFNCAKYLCQTLESVLIQDAGAEQMQIEVVDDCSTKDDPESVVRELGRGRVSFYRKPKNGGATANFNTCIERSRGRLVHILHGDDYVLPGFYDEILRLKSIAPAAYLFACRNFGIDENGVIFGVSPRLKELESENRSASLLYHQTAIQFCGVVVTRNAFCEQGGFLPALVHMADREMWIRCITNGGGIVSSKVLSNYRTFSTSDTNKLMRTGENIRDLVRLNSILAAKFSDFSKSKGQLQAALAARSQAVSFAQNGDLEASRENMRLWHDLASFKLKSKTYLRKLFPCLLNR